MYYNVFNKSIQFNVKIFIVFMRVSFICKYKRKYNVKLYKIKMLGKLYT